MLNKLRAPWQKTFQDHIIGLEKTLLETKSKLPGDQSIYLAGMLARQHDKEYYKSIQRFLCKSPEELEVLARRHYLCIGQNAPVFFISRINAEHSTVKLISKQARNRNCGLENLVSAHYFKVASLYAFKAGNRNMGEILSYIHKNYNQILGLLSTYLKFLLQNKINSNGALSVMLWQRLAESKNERNDKKEWWEKNNISTKQKQHLRMDELNQMINLSTPN